MQMKAAFSLVLLLRVKNAIAENANGAMLSNKQTDDTKNATIAVSISFKKEISVFLPTLGNLRFFCVASSKDMASPLGFIDITTVLLNYLSKMRA